MSRLAKIKLRQQARRARRAVMHRTLDEVVARRRSVRKRERAGA